jgi:dihydrofolate reductase
MRTIVSTTFLTLDGVMQAPGGSDEDARDGFAYGGWSFPFWDEVADTTMSEFMGHPFDLLLGRRTYDLFAAFWPTAPEEAGGGPLNRATKYVVSRSQPALTWEPAVLLEGEAAEAVRKLKEGDGPELQVHGSGNLMQTLMRNDLIDRYVLWVHPVVLGSGRRLFADGTIPRSLRLVDSRVSTTGVTIGTYEPAGEVVTGSFA